MKNRTKKLMVTSMKDLKVLHLETENMALKTENTAEREMLAYFADFFKSVRMEMKEQVTTEGIFRMALGKFNEAEQKSFILMNLLESIKRGEDLDKTMNRYVELGLVEAKKVPQKEEDDTSTVSTTNTDNTVKVPSGKLMMKVKKYLAKAGLILINILENIIKELYDNIKLIVGLPTGLSFLPTISIIADKNSTISLKAFVEAILGDDD